MKTTMNHSDSLEVSDPDLYIVYSLGLFQNGITPNSQLEQELSFANSVDVSHLLHFPPDPEWRQYRLTHSKED